MAEHHTSLSVAPWQRIGPVYGRTWIRFPSGMFLSSAMHVSLALGPLQRIPGRGEVVQCHAENFVAPELSATDRGALVTLNLIDCKTL